MSNFIQEANSVNTIPNEIEINVDKEKVYVCISCRGEKTVFEDLRIFIQEEIKEMEHMQFGIDISIEEKKIKLNFDVLVRLWRPLIKWHRKLKTIYLNSSNPKLVKIKIENSDADFIANYVKTIENFNNRTFDPKELIESENIILKNKLIASGIAFNDEVSLELDQYNSLKDHLSGKAFNCSNAGCGKTIVTLSSYALETNWNIPLFVFGSKSAIDSWEIQEIPKWTPEIVAKKQFVRITSKNLKNARKSLHSIDYSYFNFLIKNKKIVLINYDIVSKMINNLVDYFSVNRPYCILDEAHRLKNRNSNKTMAMLRIVGLAYRTMIVTATPTPNDIRGQSHEDLKTMLLLSNPSSHPSDFRDEEEAKRIFIQSMTFSDKLPAETVMPTSFVELDDFHKDCYINYIASKKNIQRIQGYLKSKDFTRANQSLAHIMMYLSYPSCPTIIKRLENDSDVASEYIEKLRNSGPGAKIKKTIQIAEQLLSQGKKVIIWTSWNDTANYFHNYFSKDGAILYNGKTQDKRIPLDQFNNNPNCKVFVGNIGCGEAISLHRASQHAIFNDYNYNYCYFVQSRNRHRRRNMPVGTVPTTYFIQALYEGNHDWTVDFDVEQRIMLKHNNSVDLFSRVTPVDYSEPKDELEEIHGSDQDSEIKTDIQGALETMLNLHRGIENDS
jgi:hypothetical protein